MVTVFKNTQYTQFFFNTSDFISISCLFIMIGAEFLGMIMLIVYVGAVAVLFLICCNDVKCSSTKNQWFYIKKQGSAPYSNRFNYKHK